MTSAVATIIQAVSPRLAPSVVNAALFRFFSVFIAAGGVAVLSWIIVPPSTVLAGAAAAGAAAAGARGRCGRSRSLGVTVANEKRQKQCRTDGGIPEFCHEKHPPESGT